MNRFIFIFGGILFGIAVLNFAAFAVISSQLGGDALNGKIEGDKYFLMSHGVYTEVSSKIWYYSLFHTTSVFVTHILGMIGLAPHIFCESRSRKILDSSKSAG